MECDLNGFQSIRYVNSHVDILYSYDISFAVQYKLFVFMFLLCFHALSTQQGGYVRATNLYYYYYQVYMVPGKICEKLVI